MAPGVLGHTGVELNASQGRGSDVASKEQSGTDRGLGTELGHSYLGGLGQVMATSLNLHLRVLMSF